MKNGDFSDEMFNSLKLEQKTAVDAHADELFSQGKSWKNDYLNESGRIQFITKEHVVRVAQKYFKQEILRA